MTQARKVLDEIRDYRLKGGANDKCLALFDLDSTLFNVTPRTQRILQDFVNDPEMGGRFPDECGLLAKIEVQHSDWGLKPLLERNNLITPTPDFLEALRKYWRMHFFSNRYLHLDEPYEGAVEYVQSLFRAGIEIIYLTGRDVARMEEGTYSSLYQWGFPCDKHTAHLALKPHQDLLDAEFKQEFIAQLIPSYAVIWLFENEPVNLALVEKHHPEVKIVYFDSVHSGRIQPYEHWIRISSFQVSK